MSWWVNQTQAYRRKGGWNFGSAAVGSHEELGWWGMKGLPRDPVTSIAVKCVFIVALLFTLQGSYVLREFNSAGATLPRFPFLSDSSSGLVAGETCERLGRWTWSSRQLDALRVSEGKTQWRPTRTAPQVPPHLPGSGRPRTGGSAGSRRVSPVRTSVAEDACSSFGPPWILGGQRQMWEVRSVSVASSLCVWV